MRKGTIAIIVILAIVGVGGWFLAYQKNQTTAIEQTTADEAIRTLISDFGAHMKDVPLLAATTTRNTAIDTAFGTSVSVSLRQTWKTDPSKAAGRTVSSPWPDHIEIASITKQTEDSYIVTGIVHEVTSAEEVSGGSAARYPVVLEVNKATNGWEITRYERGPYLDEESAQ